MVLKLAKSALLTDREINSVQVDCAKDGEWKRRDNVGILARDLLRVVASRILASVDLDFNSLIVVDGHFFDSGDLLVVLRFIPLQQLISVSVQVRSKVTKSYHFVEHTICDDASTTTDKKIL